MPGIDGSCRWKLRGKYVFVLWPVRVGRRRRQRWCNIRTCPPAVLPLVPLVQLLPLLPFPPQPTELFTVRFQLTPLKKSAARGSLSAEPPNESPDSAAASRWKSVAFAVGATSAIPSAGEGEMTAGSAAGSTARSSSKPFGPFEGAGDRSAPPRRPRLLRLLRLPWWFPWFPSSRLRCTFPSAWSRLKWRMRSAQIGSEPLTQV